LSDALPVGAAAVTLGHEAAGHLTETAPMTIEQAARNELRAWNLQIRVHDGLTGTLKAEARSVFGPEIDFVRRNQNAAFQQFKQNLQARCPGCP
jgi:hypothetical protein